MSPPLDLPRRPNHVDRSWLRENLAGIIFQAIVNLCMFVILWFLGTGVVEDPYFGSYWWEEYRRWTIAFALALLAGSAICLFWHWILSFVLACTGAGFFLAFYQTDCADFKTCNLVAFLGFGFMIAFALPSLVAISLAVMRKLVGQDS